MNRLMQAQGDILQMTLNLREEILGTIDDADLAFKVTGNAPLGELFAQLAGYEIAYTKSFREFALHFGPIPAARDSVAAYKQWFAELDTDLLAALNALSDDDLSRPVDRGGWSAPADIQFHIFREVVLIVAAQATVYLRAMGKEVPEQTRSWIG